MATTTVFVDDAVVGRLAPVCAKSGVGTDDHLILTVPVGGRGLGLAWLLLLLGPLGLVILFGYALTRHQEMLTVRLPFSDRSYEELARARRAQRWFGWGWAAALLGALVALVGRDFTGRAVAAALAVIALALFASWVTECIRARRAGVGVELDASRRWVTLTRVHDGFAQAVQRSYAAAPEQPASLQLS
jgi:hypothetical protein